MGDHGITCSMSRSGNVWDNAAMESFFSSLKTERTARKVYRTRNDARADVFDYIERFYNPKRRTRHWAISAPMTLKGLVANIFGARAYPVSILILMLC
jgi:putative transposase